MLATYTLSYWLLLQAFAQSNSDLVNLTTQHGSKRSHENANDRTTISPPHDTSGVVRELQLSSHTNSIVDGQYCTDPIVSAAECFMAGSAVGDLSVIGGSAEYDYLPAGNSICNLF